MTGVLQRVAHLGCGRYDGEEEEEDEEEDEDEDEDEGRVGASEEKGNTNYEGRVCFCDSNGAHCYCGPIFSGGGFFICSLRPHQICPL